jgi:hypothetical protein
LTPALAKWLRRLAAGFTCHQRRVRSTSDWIATAVCHEVPHRQFVFTIPKVLRGIFRKRRKRRQLLTHLFHTATETLRDAFRARLDLPDGKLGAIAAVIDHIPPKGKQTVRYYGIYSNKTRGQTPLIPDRILRPPSSDQKSKINNPQSEIQNPQSTILLIPAPPKQSARSMRPLWRDLILKVWGADPLQCPCCKAPMKLAGAVKRPEQIEFFLRLHGLWEGLIQLPHPPPPPFDIEKRRSLVGVLDGGAAGARRVSPPAGRANQTMEPIAPPWQAIKEWIPDDEPDLDWYNLPRNPSNSDPDGFDQSPGWKPEEVQLDDCRILVPEYT